MHILAIHISMDDLPLIDGRSSNIKSTIVQHQVDDYPP